VREHHTRTTPKRTWAYDLARAVLLAFVGAAIRAPPIFVGDGLGASDPWRHLRWAQLLRQPLPGAILEWPRFTVLFRENVDLWWAFHRLLIPFTFGDLEFGARIAAEVLGTIGLAAVAFVFVRLTPQRAGWSFVALLSFSQMTFFRSLIARPSTLTLGLLALTAWACVERRSAIAFLAAFLHGWVHVSAPLQIVVLGAAGAVDLWVEHRFPWRLSLAVLAGVAMGILLRPDPLGYVRVAWIQGTAPFAAAAAGFSDLGPELYPTTLAMFAIGAPLLALHVWTLMGTIRGSVGGRRDRVELFLALVSVAFFVLAVRGRRFLELQGTFAMFYVARCADFTGIRFAARRGARVGAALLITLGIIANEIDSLFSMPSPYSSERLERAARALAAVPRGATIFHDDWRAYAKLFFHDPFHRYLVGADPTFMLADDPRRFWLWVHLGRQGRVCDLPMEVNPKCPEPEPTADQLASAFEEFGASAVVLSATDERPELKRLLERTPSRFKKIYEGTGADDGVSVFALDVKPELQDAPR
jgi:hypothetical protein